MEKERLILGSAGKSFDDAVTLDIDPVHKPDVVHDLNIVPLPFNDNSFKKIVCHHVVEHLEGLSKLMAELHRICRPEGIIYIEVPHHSSWCANVPEHRLRFNYFAFDGYIEGGKTKWITSTKFRLVKIQITFHKSFRRFFLHKLFNKFAFSYERFWTYMFPAEHFKIWLQPIKNTSSNKLQIKK